MITVIWCIQKSQTEVYCTTRSQQDIKTKLKQKIDEIKKFTNEPDKSKMKQCTLVQTYEVPFLCCTSTESLESSEVEGDSAGGETEKSLGGSSASSSLDATRWSLADNGAVNRQCALSHQVEIPTL